MEVSLLCQAETMGWEPVVSLGPWRDAAHVLQHCSTDGCMFNSWGKEDHFHAQLLGHWSSIT